MSLTGLISRAADANSNMEVKCKKRGRCVLFKQNGNECGRGKIMFVIHSVIHEVR